MSNSLKLNKAVLDAMSEAVKYNPYKNALPDLLQKYAQLNTLIDKFKMIENKEWGTEHMSLRDTFLENASKISLDPKARGEKYTLEDAFGERFVKKMGEISTASLSGAFKKMNQEQRIEIEPGHRVDEDTDRAEHNGTPKM